MCWVLGGYRFDASTGQVTYYDSVLSSTIDAKGRLSAWKTETPFKNGRSGTSAVKAGKCLFMAGGGSSTTTSSTYYDDVQYAQIANDGSLSSWSTSPNKLKVPRSNHSLVLVTTDRGNFLEVVAGVTQVGEDTVHLDTIEVAPVAADCSIGPWTIANFHLKGGRSAPQAVVIQNNVVVIGGWGDLDLIDVYNDVQTSAPRSNGSPEPWQTASARLPTGIYGHATVVAMNEKAGGPSLLLTVGGQPGTGAYANWISYAYVSSNPFPNAVGVWRIAPTGKLPTGRAGLGAVYSRARLYVIGGNDTGKFYSDVLSARFDFGQP